MNVRSVAIFIIRTAIGAVVVLFGLDMFGVDMEALSWYKALASFLVLSIGYEILPPLYFMGWPRRPTDDSAG